MGTCQKDTEAGTSLVQGLRLRAPNAGSLGSIPGQGGSSQNPGLKICSSATKKKKIPHATIKIPHSQINKYFLKGIQSQCERAHTAPNPQNHKSVTTTVVRQVEAWTFLGYLQGRTPGSHGVRSGSWVIINKRRAGKTRQVVRAPVKALVF